MAKLIRLKHRESGLERQGVIGFSYTTLFFGPIPALLRSDFSTCFLSWGGAILVFVVVTAIAAPLGLLGGLAWWIYWSFKYNTYYTRGLLNQGFLLAGEQLENSEAAIELGVQNSQEYFTGRDTRKCPFCAEMVKVEAIVCRFCHKDLPPIEPPAASPQVSAAQISKDSAYTNFPNHPSVKK